jgi:hypothetical protein
MATQHLLRSTEELGVVPRMGVRVRDVMHLHRVVRRTHAIWKVRPGLPVRRNLGPLRSGRRAPDEVGCGAGDVLDVLGPGEEGIPEMAVGQGWNG